ncbi:Z1 domain-containing protein [Myxococcus sp. SDU36]|uniref:Z1 domain-containing protein n=1 Tax=Myxococcus sp. SDU36 TaxID=2831967 RepID=UPI002543E76C|nr:Z1 domain-containing protein [Myxococcus sp. SDU36]WIG93320.1 Z1 domain-containing protein [Myxococcus sp. SDU36]
MTATAEETRQKIVKFVQELLLDEADKTSITPELIAEKIGMVLAMKPQWGNGLDRDAVIDELIRRFSLWIGKDVSLKSDIGHEAWLVASRKRDWRYWQRYREWMERKLSYRAIEALDKSTDTVLALLEDPRRNGSWNRRGLVVGHVQSGKTGHYSGLICKGADAGYKIIIVLAGLHNNLRSQTQMRLDEAFLGFETQPVPEDMVPIGVGEIDGDPSIRPNYATNRTNTGDFNAGIAQKLGITPEQRPWLFVVKKNKTVLERLLQWIRIHVTNVHDTEKGRRIVTHLPLLLIDDEADHASVDTGEILFDADGKPDEEHQPTAINRLIRRILHTFSRSAYVGYTATPFANIFIHEKAETREEGPDLFPAGFIINLAAPSNYLGPAKVFGLKTEDGRTGGIPLVREVNDYREKDGHGGWMPANHKNGHRPLYEGKDELPPSLIKAIDAFVLSCAARRARGQEHEHCSMLVHVTRLTSVQKAVHVQVAERIHRLRQRLNRRIEHTQDLASLKALWEGDFVLTTARMAASHPELVRNDHLRWEKIEAMLPEVVSDIEVRIINGTAKDALDYADRKGAGLKVIAIGGDKLARGLTLEGLTVSYFLRASKMYDTLMQMGRWFGYRPGYLDLCRLYTTSELNEWFGHIADASEELREEFDLMASSGATPREYGLKVQAHPVLMVTSRLKMRSAKNLMLSFSGQLLETVAFYRDPDVLTRNFDVVRRLIAVLGKPEINPERTRNGSKQVWQGYLWSGIPVSEVVGFLQAYRTHPAAYKVNSLLIAEFIQSLVTENELKNWTIALIGGGDGTRLDLAEGVSIEMLHRSDHGGHPDRYSIGRLMSPRDEAIDLDEAAWNAALATTRSAFPADPARNTSGKEPDAPEIPNGPAIRRIRGFGAEGVPPRPDHGVLFLYALDPQRANLPKDSPPVIAFAISFPSSASGVKVEYKVNNVLWEQEYGAAD